jgi:hypothetical protein
VRGAEIDGNREYSHAQGGGQRQLRSTCATTVTVIIERLCGQQRTTDAAAITQNRHLFTQTFIILSYSFILEFQKRTKFVQYFFAYKNRSIKLKSRIIARIKEKMITARKMTVILANKNVIEISVKIEASRIASRSAKPQKLRTLGNTVAGTCFFPPSGVHTQS